MSRVQLQRRPACAGSTSVMALLVSLMLMVLVTATMAMTVVQVRVVQDYSRNAKTLQAADSGVVHGGAILAEALAAWSIPSATTVAKVHGYASDAESGDTSGDRDISLVKDTATNIDEVMPRNVASVSGYTDAGGQGLPQVRYDAAVDIVPTGVTRPNAGDMTERHIFHYDYMISSGGQAQIGGLENRATRLERGNFDVQVQRPSFSTYGYFTQGMKNQFNQQLVFFDGETYSGPTHVNSAPPEGRAGFYGTPVFNGAFTAVQGTYEESWLGGNADPQFNGGATWGVQQIELPSNGWSQARAALGDYAGIDDQTPLTNEQLRSILGLEVSGDPVPPGVYCKNEETGKMLGGIYIQGDAASIQLSVSGSNQIISIGYKDSEGQSHAVVVTENVLANTCSVTEDGSDEGWWNKPMNGVIHVEGSVKGIGGDGDAMSGDVQSHAQLTVSSTGNMYVTDHITYQSDPRDYPTAKNILGLFSSGGNIYLGKDAPANLKLHATVMAASTGHGIGTEGLVNGNNYNLGFPDKGMWNLLGGLIENKNQTTGVYVPGQGIHGYKWNFDYDTRFLEGVSPPYFPYVTKFTIAMQNKSAQAWGRKHY